MTNAEKFEEVFGVVPDTDCCPATKCSECPANNGNFDCASIWWRNEYKEKSN